MPVTGRAFPPGVRAAEWRSPEYRSTGSVFAAHVASEAIESAADRIVLPFVPQVPLAEDGRAVSGVPEAGAQGDLMGLETVLLVWKSVKRTPSARSPSILGVRIVSLP